MALDAAQRAERTSRAGPAARRLAGAGVTIVALCWVDNTGVTRAKTVPLGRLERVAGWGVGMSPVFDVFLVNDDITTSKYIGGPGGDLRLLPDTERITPLAGQPGWAWAPVDRYTQEGQSYAGCQRSFTRRMTDRGRRARPGAADELRGGVGGRHRGRRGISGRPAPAPPTA